MKKNIPTPDFEELRIQAEKKLSENESPAPSVINTMDNLRLIHELSVHQMELELQNEELQNSVQLSQSLLNKYRLLFDFAPIPYFTLDRLGNFVDCNKHAFELLGIEGGNIKNRNFSGFVDPSSLVVFDRFFNEIFSSSSHAKCDVILEGADAKEVFAVLTGIQFHDSATCLIAIVDSTEEVIVHRKLEEYSRVLEEANNTKDKFFAIISHDLRSPFHILLNLSELLLTDFDLMNRDEKINLITSLNVSIKRQYDLLSDLLDWSIFHKKGFTIKRVFVDIQQLIDSQFLDFEATASFKKISFVNNTRKNATVWADLYMLKLIFRNLISNAIKFSYPGGKIVISSEEVANFTEISVEDQGTGIGEDDLGKLFRIDTRLSTEGTLKEKGTGLGLNISKGVIDLHGGTINIQSALGKGTKVTFSLPKK
ncbi:MAG: PAS domain-containing protein [Ignavibacteria bacterium]|nr:PAS domain-containing protein [Ignavibacteria bacterium]